jgi:hypothetical protein
MPKGNPVFFSLKSWIMLESRFNSMLMITLKPYPVWTLLTVVLKLVSKAFLTVVVGFNVTLITLGDNSFRVLCVIAIKATHISTITQINNHVRFNVIDEVSQPVKSFITCT